MKTRLTIAVVLFVFLAVIFIVSYFVFSLQLRQFVAGELSFDAIIASFKQTAFIIGLVSTGLVIGLFWLTSTMVLRDIDHLVYEMEQIAKGNIDIEIRQSTHDIFRNMSRNLEAVRSSIKLSHESADRIVEEKTRLLTKKIDDLEKLRDLTTDSILLAKQLQQERDQMLLQMHQLQDKRKKS